MKTCFIEWFCNPYMIYKVSVALSGQRSNNYWLWEIKFLGFLTLMHNNNISGSSSKDSHQSQPSALPSHIRKRFQDSLSVEALKSQFFSFWAYTQPCRVCVFLDSSPAMLAYRAWEYIFGWTHSFLNQKWLRKCMKLNVKFLRHFNLKSNFHLL